MFKWFRNLFKKKEITPEMVYINEAINSLYTPSYSSEPIIFPPKTTPDVKFSETSSIENNHSKKYEDDDITDAFIDLAVAVAIDSWLSNSDIGSGDSSSSSSSSDISDFSGGGGESGGGGSSGEW